MHLSLDGIGSLLIAFVVLPAVAALVGFTVWKITGDSDAALIAGLPGSLGAVGAAILSRADKLRLAKTARTLWVTGGLISTVAAWCIYLSAWA